MLAPLLATALAVSSPAVAEKPEVRAEAPARKEDGHSLLGVALDVGIPSGAGASLLVRPFPWLRLHGGVATNSASVGLQGGVTFTPLRSFVTPTFTVEAGHFFEGDASGYLGDAIALPDYGEEMLRRVYYDFGSAHLGVELGSQDGFLFYVRGGLSYLWSTIYGVESALSSREERVSFQLADPEIQAVIPSAELGFALFFL